MKEIIIKDLERKLAYVENLFRDNPNRVNLAYIVDIQSSINKISNGEIVID